MTAPFHLTGQVLAQRELDDYTVTPGILGFVIFAAMGVGVWLLLKSMTRQLNRVNFKEQDPAGQVCACHGEGRADCAARTSADDGAPKDAEPENAEPENAEPEDEVPAGYRREPTS